VNQGLGVLCTKDKRSINPESDSDLIEPLTNGQADGEDGVSFGKST